MISQLFKLYQKVKVSFHFFHTEQKGILHKKICVKHYLLVCVNAADIQR